VGNQIRYRNYTHDEGEVAFEINQVANLNPANGVIDTVTHLWTLSGELLVTDGSDNQAELSTRINALAAAYSVPGGDLVFLLDDGTASSHLIRSNATIGGTKVLSFDWLNGPAEYSNHRSYRITLRADYAVPPNSGLTYWKETYEFSGGGPKIRHQESVRGRPRAQTIKKFTIYRARQFGTIVGQYTYPAWPSPLWPNPPILLTDLTRKSSDSPTPTGTSGRYRFKDYSRSYSYEFEGPSPLVRMPNLWVP
jgi:hypothetical protein